MSSQENKTLVQRFVEEVMNGQNLGALNQFYDQDYAHHDPSLPPELQRGLENYKQVLGMFFVAFPDMVVTIEDLIAEGDKVASRWTIRGTHRGELMGLPASGRPVDFSLSIICRVANGKVAEGWVNFDAMGMMQQVGAIPAPSGAAA